MTVLSEVDIGDSVKCDDCNKEYRASSATGGILFQSKAICPMCTPKWEADAVRYGETWMIRGRCPAGVTFHAWVMELRGGDNTIRVVTLDL